MTAPSAEVLYLWDGTKVRTSSALGQGRLYKGSFVYSASPTGTQLESISHDEGRILAATGTSGTEFIDTWHVRDYLGSVRAIYDISTPANEVEDASEHVLEQNDYYAFGERIDDGNQTFDQTNRYRYNGKEQLRFEGINLDPGLTDYGARYYAPTLGRWTTPDPLADKYYSISPYAFCNNNPVNFVDPDGRFYGDPVRNPDIRRNQASNLMGEGIRILHNKPRNHQGFDYYAPLGTEVLTVKDGIVVQSGGYHESYGKTVTIKHVLEDDTTVYSFYAHLSEVLVEEGDRVSEGEIIAKSGDTGNAAGTSKLDEHLHFELRTQAAGMPGLSTKLNPNQIIDTKFITQDKNAPQNKTGIIKIYKDGRREFKNIIL